ncbi:MULTISPECIES: c-type cytochrome [Acidobacteriaceae]|uniref:c-type cytochrome n=1 Tax=Acidobacteriaceae TaxID=204434 RepID=UPI00131E6462|nr:MULTISPECIES: c-type cytochrome [Acidobacteriaceae]MDW5264200.1 c-type cytochrome [Edaphobacter sp.]
MLKPLLALPALLLFVPSPQQPAPANIPATAAAAPAMPADAKTLVNPVKPTADSQTQAKKMYGYDCAVCHGENGNGKGDLAADMKPPLKDYTDPAALKDLTDGEIFYIIKNGKGQMTGEGDRLNKDGTWNMVILVRSFAKK